MSIEAEKSYPSKSKIKVINIVEDGRYAGPQSRIIKVAVLLKDVGIETTVVCPTFDSDIFVNELRKNEVSYILLRIHRMTLQLSHLMGFIFGFIPEIIALKKLIKAHQGDVIHCNGCWQLKGMIAARLAKTHASVVYHLNDTYTRRGLKVVFTLLACKLVDAFIPACERSKDYYLKDLDLACKLSRIIPAPVDTTLFDPDNVEADSRIKKLPGLKILTVCNINRGKGIDELVELCDTLAATGSNQTLSFCIVGPVHKSQKSYFKEVADKIKKKNLSNIHFMGGTKDVPAALKAADIYICVSHFESSPMAVWEAMAMGKPIVSTDVGDVKKYVEEGGFGFCVPVGDIGQLKDKILALVHNKNLREEMGKTAREFAINNLDLTICAQKHGEFYRTLVGNKKV